MAINPFNTVKVEVPNANQFDLSFDNKLSLDMGKLYPVLVQDTLPGDYFNITPEMFVRLAPMVFPIMHRIDVRIHFFYVPNRILNEDFPQFLAGEPVVPPYFQGTESEPLTVTAGSIFDYLNLPISENITEPIDAFPFMAYCRIYNEYYVDQNNDTGYVYQRDLLKDTIRMNGRISSTSLGAPEYSDFPIFKCAYEHDYFTSCLPFAQKGEPVKIPISLSELEGDTIITKANPIGGGSLAGDLVAGGSPLDGIGIDDGSGAVWSYLSGTTTIDGSGAEVEGTINQLRTALALQKFLEKNARSGTRYNELIRAHFGTDVGDARISRPEYIGGIKNNVVISEVLQTSSSTEDTALGDYAGHGQSLVGGNTISYQCKEHGYIIGIMSILPKTGYYQGIPRKYSRLSHLDYYWSDFAQIGEQSVLNKEVYYDNDDLNNETFGYLPRYSEYKYNPTEIHGDMRTTMMDFHLVRKFDSRPVLGNEFIYVTNDKRIFAVQDEDVHSFYAHIYFNIRASRKIPYFSNPAGL